MSRVLVTGGAGFIGSHLVDALVDAGHRVTVVDDLSSGKRANVNDQAELVRDDIRSSRMLDVFRGVQPEYVFHLAAQKSVGASVRDPRHDADVNVMGTLNLLEQAGRFGIRKFIFSSTGGAIYGPTKRLPTPESEPPRPQSPYAVAKLAAEHYCAFYSLLRKLPVVTLRYANVYGPRQDPDGEAGVVAIFSKLALRREPLVINGDGAQTRDFIYVSDVVASNLAAMKPKLSGTYNIGTGIRTSINSLAAAILAATGSKSRIRHGAGLEGEVRKSALAISLARRHLGWKPATDLRTGLALTSRYFSGLLESQ